MNKIYLMPTDIDAYAFVKGIASKKLNIDIEKIEILKTDKGKPYLKNIKDFFFNISNSYNLQAVAISDFEVGVDIELVREVDLSVAKRFTKFEYNYILSEKSLDRFFEVWTKKEAYLKYKSLGLSGGLNRFNVFDLKEKIKTKKIDGYYLSVCGERDFKIEKTLA